MRSSWPSRFTRAIEPAAGAEILLLFHTVAEDQDAYFEVRQVVACPGGEGQEILSVFKDGVYDAWYSDNWAQQVEELVPLEISQLFFFDAEKIRTLTEDEHQQPGAGGGDQVAAGPGYRRAADRRRRGHPGPAGEGRAPRQPSREGRGPGERRPGAERPDRAAGGGAERAGEPPSAGRHAQETAEMKFLATGGPSLAASPGTGREEERAGNPRSGEIEAQLLQLAAGELPLALVPELLKRVEHQDLQERLATQAGSWSELLAERDEPLDRALAQARASAQGHRAGAGGSSTMTARASGGDGQRSPG